MNIFGRSVNEFSLLERICSPRGNCPVEWKCIKEMLDIGHQDLLFIDMEFSFDNSRVYTIALVDAKGKVVTHILVDYSSTVEGSREALVPFLRFSDRILHQKSL